MNMSVAVLAHEIRTPLATLRATLELLEDVVSQEPKEANQLVLRLQRSVAWIDEVVENLTTSAAMEVGHAPRSDARASMPDCLDQTLNLLTPILEQHGQRIQVDCRRASPAVGIDEQSLQQILLNLLTNAC